MKRPASRNVSIQSPVASYRPPAAGKLASIVSFEEELGELPTLAIGVMVLGDLHVHALNIYSARRDSDLRRLGPETFRP